MIRFGIVSEIDAAKGLARVNFTDDDIVSPWLKITVPNTKENKDEIWLDVNEHVWCIVDEHCEYGVVGGAVYDENNLPSVGDPDKRVTTFSDGTTIEYDRANSILTITCVGDVKVVCENATVEASTGTTVDTPTATFTGDVQVDGNLNVDGDATGSGSITAQGDIETTGGDVKAPGGINLTTHKHTGVQPGPGVTGTPIP